MTSKSVIVPAATEQVDEYVNFITNKNCFLPLADIPGVRRVIEAALVPATTKEVGKVLAVLSGSFKWPSTEVIENRELYLVAMAAALRRYPYGVLMDAIGEAVREEPWQPAVCVMVKLADTKVGRLRKALLRLEQLPDEHRRIREADAREAKRAARRAEEAARRAEEAARICDHLHREFEAHIEPLPLDDFAAAWFALSLIHEREDLWARAIRGRWPWIRDAVKFMVVAGYLLVLLRRKLVALKEVEDMIYEDLSIARRRVAELGTIPPTGPEWFDDGIEYNYQRICQDFDILGLMAARYEEIQDQFKWSSRFP